VRRALESGLPAWLRRPGTHQPGQCSRGAASDVARARRGWLNEILTGGLKS